ncbi:uncharacterized protein A1O9_03547 [Exophiala aquamarina CBS 119918]|uniref:mRNA N(6)-methyladenine demethylase n=1 Tax=Exophiala aquamarina CBS 119918 TaxID=1182545 RepID=A0A072Q255_9EURO|nr:uncharacterized protein A1O9_03547 [Exophiala aquamarina CBS 119918]KEF61975.1 hypothetical protein A1O9_03547 [Exophiala aquamarina CBS 119918]
MSLVEDAEGVRRPNDPYAKPPEPIKHLFKYWRKTADLDLRRSSSEGVSDVFLKGPRGQDSTFEVIELTELIPNNYKQVLMTFCGPDAVHFLPNSTGVQEQSAAAFEVSSLPGLYVFPSLLPPHVQIALLERLLHRDLQNPSHKTNVDLHYHVPVPSLPKDASRGIERSPGPGSFFGQDRDSDILPKEPAVHKSITLMQMLESKLRWVTLGGQYDWTKKVYPSEVPPAFPSDIADFIKGLFPDVNPQAAIVNFYSPGDTLSVHRDVSEDCANSLISVSIGCDALFIAGNQDGSRTSTMRLKSGDVLLMSGESRYAWHAVPKIIPGTCPHWLEDWPGGSDTSEYQVWRGWMSNKRINLNVRQMASSGE